MSATHLALFRGINVGGKNKLSMSDLVQLFVDAGCSNVRTYIQSGNVVFDVNPELAQEVPGVIGSKILERFGYQVPVLVRTAAQMHEVARANPFLDAGAAVEALHVMFLSGVPAPDLVRDLDPERSRPDAFVVRGQEVYLSLPNGVARTKLTNDYFDSKLSTTSTARNWKTVVRLVELMRE